MGAFGGQFADTPGGYLLPNGEVASAHIWGLAANRPPACYRNNGLVYVATDTGAAWLSTGSAWVSIGSAGAVTSVTASAPIASSGGATPNITHNTSGATAGAYTNANITIDAYGHVTVASNGSSGSGTVTSVGLSLPSIFSVTGSPVTTSGTLTGTLANQTANTVFAGPTTGAAAAPTFRAIVAADLPVFVASGASHAAGAVPDPGSTAGTTRYLREDATWAVPPGNGQGVVGVNAQTGTTYTFANADSGLLVTFNNAAAVAVTLNHPQSGQFANGWWVLVENLGAGTVTLTPSGSTIDGGSSLAVPTNQGVIVVSDGSNYFTSRGLGMVNPMTTLGDLIYENGTPAAARLAGNATTTKQFLTQTGTGSVSAAPAWGGITQADLPAPVAPVVNWQAALTHI